MIALVKSLSNFLLRPVVKKIVRSIAITIVKYGLQFEDTTNVIEREREGGKKTEKYWMFTQEFTPLVIYVTNYSSIRFAYSNDSF